VLVGAWHDFVGECYGLAIELFIHIATLVVTLLYFAALFWLIWWLLGVWLS
jgi:hypothetical protein